MEMKKTLLLAAIYGSMMGALSLALPLFLDAQGYSIASIGWIFGAAVLISGLLGIGLGALSDKFGRKPLIALYNLLTVAATAIIAGVGGAYAFIAGKSLGNFASAGLWNALLSRMSDISKKNERALYFGKYLGVFALSFALVQLLAGEVIERFGFTFLFIAVIVVALLGVAVTLLFNEVGRRRETHHFSLEVLKSRNGKVHALASFMNGIGTSAVYSYVLYIFLAERYLFSPAQIGLFIAATFSLWGIASYFTGKFVDRLGMRQSYLYGGLINGACWLGAAAFLGDFWLFFAFIALENFTFPLMNLAGTKLASVIPKEENVGRDISVFGYAHSLGVLVSVSLAGMIAEIDYAYVFLGRAGAFIIAGLVVWYGITLRD